MFSLMLLMLRCLTLCSCLIHLSYQSVWSSPDMFRLAADARNLIKCWPGMGIILKYPFTDSICLFGLGLPSLLQDTAGHCSAWQDFNLLRYSDWEW